MDVHELIEAIRRDDTAEVEALLEAQPLLAEADADGNSAVLTAKYYGRDEALQLLLDQNPELNIFEAAAVGDTERVRECVASDPTSVNATAPDGFQPLGLAAFFGNEAAFDVLLSAGADVDSEAQNDFKVRPIHAAVANGNMSVIRKLIAVGADVNARQQRDFTPLHEAARSGNEEMVSTLLAAGANRAARDADGRTPADHARENGHGEIAVLLAP